LREIYADAVVWEKTYQARVCFLGGGL
jgi:hypothetical protein